MNNLLSYCGLVDGRISASEKDLPVKKKKKKDHSLDVFIGSFNFEKKAFYFFAF